MKKNIQITDRDYKILRYVWKWKALSTNALAIKFFPEATSLTAYKRLLQLGQANYLKAMFVNESSNQQVWGLSTKGFQHIEQYLGELRIKGFKSANPTHDYLATAFQLGEWLLHQPDNTQTWTERQLLCVSPELWPFWVPRSQTHRPDGFTAFNRNNSRYVVAFETELNVKSTSRYEPVVAYYDSQDDINFVFWLIESLGNYNSIESAFKKFSMRKLSKHNFILLKDFKKYGWLSPFSVGEFKGKTLLNFLGARPHSSPGLASVHGVSLRLVNAQKKPIISNISSK